MAAHAAVGVDDDLAAGEAGVAHRAADDEAAGRVDVGTWSSLSSKLGRHDLLDHVLAGRTRAALSSETLGAVLGADDDGVDGGRGGCRRTRW